VLGNAVSPTVEGQGVLVYTALAVLDVNGDELLDPARAEVLWGSGVDVAMNPVVLDDVNASALVLTAVADDDMLLLIVCVDGLGVTVLGILEEGDDVNTSMVAALVAEDDVPPLEAAAEADVAVPVPPAVLGNTVSATVEGPGVLVFTALAVLDVDGDELLDAARAEVLLGSGADVAMNPVVLDDVNTSTLVPTAVADDDGLLLSVCVNGLGVAVPVLLEEVDDVNTSVVAALVAEDDVLPLDAAAEADVEVLVPPAVLGNAVSATVEGQGVLVYTALAVLDVEGDELFDPAGAEVLLGSGVDVAMNPGVLDDVNASALVLTAVADDDMLLLIVCVDGLGGAVLGILEEGDDVNTSMVAALVAEDDMPLLEAAAEADVAELAPPAVLGNTVSATVEGPGGLVFTALAVLDVDGDELLDAARAEVLLG